jgi:hypothetical protein
LRLALKMSDGELISRAVLAAGEGEGGRARQVQLAYVLAKHRAPVSFMPRPEDISAEADLMIRVPTGDPEVGDEVLQGVMGNTGLSKTYLALAKVTYSRIELLRR